MEPEGLLLSLFRWIYRRRSPRPPGEVKPRLAWLPRYRVPCTIDGSLRQGGEDALEARLETLGFEIDHWTKEAVVFKRGHRWGDFSVELVRLRLTLPRPVEAISWFQLELDDVCLFDTGDLWALSGELEALLKAGEK
ncbi:MAG: hypothetical protein AAGE01_23220 [Pseudomonadota bacterium]